MEEQSLERISQQRCIQVEDDDNPTYVDYHVIYDKEDQEQLNGEYLVDYIIQQRFFPNGLWKSV